MIVISISIITMFKVEFEEFSCSASDSICLANLCPVGMTWHVPKYCHHWHHHRHHPCHHHDHAGRCVSHQGRVHQNHRIYSNREVLKSQRFISKSKPILASQHAQEVIQSLSHCWPQWPCKTRTLKLVHSWYEHYYQTLPQYPSHLIYLQRTLSAIYCQNLFPSYWAGLIIVFAEPPVKGTGLVMGAYKWVNNCSQCFFVQLADHTIPSKLLTKGLGNINRYKIHV